MDRTWSGTTSMKGTWYVDKYLTRQDVLAIPIESISKCSGFLVGNCRRHRSPCAMRRISTAHSSPISQRHWWSSTPRRRRPRGDTHHGAPAAGARPRALPHRWARPRVEPARRPCPLPERGDETVSRGLAAWCCGALCCGCRGVRASRSHRGLSRGHRGWR